MRFVVGIDIEDDDRRWTWWVENPATNGVVVAAAPDHYDDEKAARSAINKARVAMRGSRMARVDVLNSMGEESPVE